MDAPPLHGVADAAVLSKVTDSALLVVRANHTRTVDVERSMDLLERVGARLAGAVLNALPRKLPTGGAWHRGDAVPAAGSDPELVTQLFGAGATGRDDGFTGPAAGDETVIIRIGAGTARGRAPVVKATVGTPEEAEQHPRDGAGAEAARGQARVVVAQPADEVVRPEPPHLPVQRTPDEKPQPGE